MSNNNTASNENESSNLDKDKQFPFQSFFPSTINFNDIENIILPFDDCSFQGINV